MRRTEYVFVILILIITAGLRFSGLLWAPPGLAPDEALVGIAVPLFGHTLLALRLASALAGMFTLVGLYALARRMFDDWRIAALATYLMGVGFLPLVLSRLALPIVLAPLCSVWLFFEFYKGIETHRIWHWAVAGLWLGLGFYTTPLFAIVPLIVIAALASYWLSLHAVFSHDKYHIGRNQMLGGVSAMAGVAILTFLPSLFIDTSTWLGPAGATWQFGIAGQPLLFWPVTVLLAVGFLRTLWRFVESWHKRDHPGVVHTILLAWLLLGALPLAWFVSPASPALRIVLALPAIYIFAGLGLHWLMIWLERWYQTSGHRHSIGSITIATLSFVLALTVADAMQLFTQWAPAPETAAAFAAPAVQAAQRLQSLPPATLKYVVTDSSTPTIMYLTDSATPAQQRAHNIYYLTPKEFIQHKYPHGAVVVQLTP